MINLMAFSTDAVTDRSLMHAVGKGGIALRVHYGNKTAHYKASSLSRTKGTQGTRGHLMDASRRSGAAGQLFNSASFREGMEVFVDHMWRTDGRFRLKSHNLQTISDYYDYFYILADAFAAQMRDEQITHVWFANIPHLSYDSVAYLVARALGLETLFFAPSWFPGRYTSMRRIGHHGMVPPGLAPQPFTFDKSDKVPFYMGATMQQRTTGGKLSAKAWAQIIGHYAMHAPGKLVNPAHMARVFKRAQAVAGQLPDWRDPFAGFFSVNELEYYEHILGFEEGEVDLSRRFVYVPLHMQPEMTTSSIGGLYRDQALMIEHLRDIVPDDVAIYVKENPKQTAWGRGPLFFHRLRRLDNVHILPSYANTYQLRDAAEAVVTVTGTVGWEALKAERPVIAFGWPEYRSLPGVYAFDFDLDYETVRTHRFDWPALEGAIGALQARTHSGVVDRHYAQLVDGYNEAANDVIVGETLHGLLTGKVEPTFVGPDDTAI